MSAVKGGVEWTQDEIDTLRSLVEAGIAPSKFPTILGRSEGSIRARASRSKIPLKYMRKCWSDLMPRVIALQEQGYSYEEIAEIVQRSPDSVRGAFYRFRKKQKLHATQKRTLREQVESVLQQYLGDEHVPEVAAKLLTLVAEVSGVADSTVDFKNI